MKDASSAGSAGVQVIAAQPIVEVHDAPPSEYPSVLEGPAFDTNGDVYLTSLSGDAEGNRVFKVSIADRSVEPVYADGDSNFTAIAIHADGTLYLTDLGMQRGAGRIVTMRPDGTDVHTLVDRVDGTLFFPDDLVFDSAGTLFFNDMQGSVIAPTGRVFRRSPGDGRVELVTGGLASPNGLALSPAEDQLWASEHTGNRLLSIRITPDGAIDDGPFPGSGIYVRTHLSGGMADSVTVDSAGNVYVAMFSGGRVVVVDSNGHEVAMIVPEGGLQALPHTTHVAIRPGTCEGVLVATGPGRAAVLEFESLAPGLVPFAFAAAGS